MRFKVGGVNWLCSICSASMRWIRTVQLCNGSFSVNALEHIYYIIMLTNIQACLLMFQQRNEKNKIEILSNDTNNMQDSYWYINVYT